MFWDLHVALSYSPDKHQFCCRLVWIHRILLDMWRFFAGWQKNRLVCSGLYGVKKGAKISFHRHFKAIEIHLLLWCKEYNLKYFCDLHCTLDQLYIQNDHCTCILLAIHHGLQYSPEIMHAQEVAQDHESGKKELNCAFSARSSKRNKFKILSARSRKKLWVLPQTANNREKFTVL